MILPWLARIAGLRARADTRLLLVVLAVAVVSCTMVTSLALLVTVTEQGGLRAALSGSAGTDAADGAATAASDATAIDVTVTAPSVPVSEVRTAVAASVDSALAGAVPSASTVIALTDLIATTGTDPGGASGSADPTPLLAYLGELDRIDSAATLTDGEWPAMPAARTGAVDVAIPEAAAEAFGLAVGDSLRMGDVAVAVAGIYRVDDPAASYWSADRLGGAGIDRDFPLPGTLVYVRTDAIGPLVTAPGILDAAGLPVRTIDLRFRPDFGALALDDLGAVADRLSTARTRVPAQSGDIGERVAYSSDLAEVVQDAAAGLVVTRSTVVTVGLLLLLVAVVALSQSARLLTDSRTDERRLLRARGASLAGIRGMTAIEAGAIGLVTAVAGPLLASLVYRAVAAAPAMRAAGIPADAGLPPLAWVVSAVTSAVFAVVLVAPLARPAELFDDERGEQRAARRIRPLGLVRPGIDVGVAALAVVLYQQLITYRPPVGEPSVRIDPLLVIAPALLLGACSYLAVRLVPATAMLFEYAGSRARGAVIPLASWEVGRRTRQATAVVLLLTLALAVGSFGSTFLGTWRQSQTDQAAFALGAPARVPADPETATTQAGALAEGARGRPEAVLRRVGRLAGPSAIGSGALGPSGPTAAVLGLGPESRAMLDRDRLAREGGAVIERMLRAEVAPTVAVTLPESTARLGLTIRIGEPGEAFPGVLAAVSAIVENRDGLLSTVPLGSAPVDGSETTLQGAFPQPGSATGLAGVVVDFGVDDTGTFQLRTGGTRATVLLGRIEVFAGDDPTGPSSGRPLDLREADSWLPHVPTPFDRPAAVATPPEGWQLALQLTIPRDVDGRRAIFSLTGWSDPETLPVVASARLAELMSIGPRSDVTLVVGGAQIPGEIVGIVPLIPGSARGPDARDLEVTDVNARDSDAVVVDQVLLSRYLVVANSPGPAVDEWWVDVAPGQGQAYLDLHADDPAAVGAESSEAIATDQAEGPLRIATPAALSLVIAGAVVLTVVGFAVHTAASMRARRTEFAQLRAIGLARRSLVSLIGAESVLLSVLGTVFGIVVGVLLGAAVTPLVGLSPDGSAPRPSVEVVVPVIVIAGLAVVVGIVVVAVVLGVAGPQRSADPAGILRGGD